MFYFNTIIKPSRIHGLGLFTEEDISKGKKVYRINEDLDLTLSDNHFLKLDDNEKKIIKHYGYFDKKEKDGIFLLMTQDLSIILKREI